MMSQLRSVTNCLLLALTLSACGSSPPVRYFSLSSTVASGAQTPDQAVVLGVGPMRMAEYLDRSQLVTRGAGAEIQVDEFNRWAEPLSVAFLRVVSTDVDDLLEGVTVLAYPWESAARAQVAYRLLGEVTRFDADESGEVLLETQWGIVKTDSDEWLVKPHRTRYTAQAGSSGDADAVAAAMNEALAKFSRDVANEMLALLQR